MKKRLAILLCMLSASIMLFAEPCSCKEHGKPNNPKNKCCGEEEYDPNESFGKKDITLNVDKIQKVLDVLSNGQKKALGVNKEVSVSPGIYISWEGFKKCCNNELLTKGRVSAGGDVGITLPSIGANIPVPQLANMVSFYGGFGVSGRASLSGATQFDCETPSAIFSLNSSIVLTGTVGAKLISEQVLSASASIGGDVSLTGSYTLYADSDLTSGDWSLSPKINSIKLSYEVVLVTCTIKRGEMELL